jgi:hypothetical protein
MKSDFPMTFASDSQEPLHDSGAQKPSGKKHDRGSNVIPLSRGNVTFIPLSEAKPLTEAVSSRMVDNDNTMAGDYPMSEFHDEESGTTGHSRRDLKPILRGVMLSLMLGLWVAVGTGYLNSSTPGISHLRAVFSLSDETSISLPPISHPAATEKSEQSPSALSPAVLSPSDETLRKTGEVVPQNQSVLKPSGAQSPAADMTQSDGSAVRTQADIEGMARLYLSQLEQFNAAEEHMVRLVLAHASQSERDAFLAGLQKKHESALSKLQGQRQNSAR